MISLSEEEKGDSENYPSSTSVDRDGEFLKQHDKLAVVGRCCVQLIDLPCQFDLLINMNFLVKCYYCPKIKLILLKFYFLKGSTN